MRRQLSAEQIAFARYLKQEYGKKSAIAYLKLVTQPDYRHNSQARKAERGIEISLSHRTKEVENNAH